MKQTELPDHQARCACDLDGVLTVGAGRGPFDFAPLRPGAKDFLQELHRRYEEVYIHTARDVGAAKNWLRQNGLLKFAAGVSNVKLPAKVYIDDRGVSFRGNFKATLKEIKDFQPHWQQPEGDDQREFSSTQVDLPEGAAKQVREMAAKVKDEDLHEKGRETEPHITVKYGLETDDPEPLRKALAGHGSVKARLGSTSLFKTDEFDVLKIDVRSPDLHRLNKVVSDLAEHTDTFPTYTPHVTVAYLKPGAGQGYVGNRSLEGTELEFDWIVFSGRDGKMETIPLVNVQR